jgi:hypothetical protein
MGLGKKRRQHRLYIPWYTSDEDLYEEEENEEESWVSYVRRNLKHPVGQESPFPDSSWSYTRHDSPFDDYEDDEGQLEKKSDGALHDEVSDTLYHLAQVDASDIKSIVLNGIVCLFGTVDSEFSKRKAERVIKNLPGVWSVKNELKVEQEKKRSLSQSGPMGALS